MKTIQKFDEKFIEFNKSYYKDIEDYDWVEVTDKLKGLESFFHKLREYWVLRLINKNLRGTVILDAGCGTGLILRHLPHGSYGVDINPRNIKRAKVHAPKAQIVKADIEKLPFKDNFFSTIVCTEVIEHQPDPNPTIKEFIRVLQKGGVLIGSVPSDSPIWFLRFLSSTCPRGEPFHKNFKCKELKSLFREFKILHLARSVLGMSYFFVLEK
ncbi:MAG: class I SAM-dependent methyltransferase [Candidatus Curtissbacteria bacterium]|nr:class I SAM-dependent methyltransferase [Candidatus Curtissbacteria bacterium]